MERDDSFFGGTVPQLALLGGVSATTSLALREYFGEGGLDFLNSGAFGAPGNQGVYDLLAAGDARRKLDLNQVVDALFSERMWDPDMATELAHVRGGLVDEATRRVIDTHGLHDVVAGRGITHTSGFSKDDLVNILGGSPKYLQQFNELAGAYGLRGISEGNLSQRAMDLFTDVISQGRSFEDETLASIRELNPAKLKKEFAILDAKSIDRIFTGQIDWDPGQAYDYSLLKDRGALRDRIQQVNRAISGTDASMSLDFRQNAEGVLEPFAFKIKHGTKEMPIGIVRSTDIGGGLFMDTVRTGKYGETEMVSRRVSGHSTLNALADGVLDGTVDFGTVRSDEAIAGYLADNFDSFRNGKSSWKSAMNQLVGNVQSDTGQVYLPRTLNDQLDAKRSSQITFRTSPISRGLSDDAIAVWDKEMLRMGHDASSGLSAAQVNSRIRSMPVYVDGRQRVFGVQPGGQAVADNKTLAQVQRAEVLRGDGTGTMVRTAQSFDGQGCRRAPSHGDPNAGHQSRLARDDPEVLQPL